MEVEIAPLEQLGADLLQVRVGPGSRMHGVYVEELRLPPGAHVTLIVREGRSLVPDPHTHFVHGDQVLVVATSAVRDAAESRLRAVARGAVRLSDRAGERQTTAPLTGVSLVGIGVLVLIALAVTAALVGGGS